MELLVVIICGIPEFGNDSAVNIANKLKNIINNKNINNNIIYKELLGKNITIKNITNLLIDTANYLSEPNKKAIVYYNGHGTQLPDNSGDETDGLDEGWYLMGGGILSDDKLSKIFLPIHDDSFLFLISDSCSSGTMIDKKINNRPWISLSSCKDNENSLSSVEGGIFTLFGLLPAIEKYNNITDIHNYIKNNINIPSQNVRLEITREYLKNIIII